MAQKGNNRGKAPRGINPQGYGPDTEYSMEPKSQLEQKAKKSNTKR
ncbi:small, acid-soluble spore protein L [Fredinandcohnia sp. 179-A 10B2 NHS]